MGFQAGSLNKNNYYNYTMVQRYKNGVGIQNEKRPVEHKVEVNAHYFQIHELYPRELPADWSKQMRYQFLNQLETLLEWLCNS